MSRKGGCLVPEDVSYGRVSRTGGWERREGVEDPEAHPGDVLNY